jgi:hypothetical protein
MPKQKIHFPKHDPSTEEDLRIEIPRQIVHRHTYGKTSEYFRALAEGKILGTRCNACNLVFLPPRPDCSECWQKTEWVELPHHGKVATFAVVDYPGEGFIEDLQSVNSKLPCVIVYVEIEGVDTKLMSRLEDCDPKDVSIGMEVEARFVENPNQNCLDIYWVPRKK